MEIISYIKAEEKKAMENTIWYSYGPDLFISNTKRIRLKGELLPAGTSVTIAREVERMPAFGRNDKYSFIHTRGNRTAHITLPDGAELKYIFTDNEGAITYANYREETLRLYNVSSEIFFSE